MKTGFRLKLFSKPASGFLKIYLMHPSVFYPFFNQKINFKNEK